MASFIQMTCFPSASSGCSAGESKGAAAATDLLFNPLVRAATPFITTGAAKERQTQVFEIYSDTTSTLMLNNIFGIPIVIVVLYFEVPPTWWLSYVLIVRWSCITKIPWP